MDRKVLNPGSDISNNMTLIIPIFTTLISWYEKRTDTPLSTFLRRLSEIMYTKVPSQITKIIQINTSLNVFWMIGTISGFWLSINRDQYSLTQSRESFVEEVEITHTQNASVLFFFNMSHF